MIIKRVSRITPQSKPSIALSDVGVDQSRRCILRAGLEDKLIERLNRRSHIGRELTSSSSACRTARWARQSPAIAFCDCIAAVAVARIAPFSALILNMSAEDLCSIVCSCPVGRGWGPQSYRAHIARPAPWSPRSRERIHVAVGRSAPRSHDCSNHGTLGLIHPLIGDGHILEMFLARL